MSYTCTRCSCDLEEPLTENADYVTGENCVEQCTREVHAAVILPDDPQLNSIPEYRLANAFQKGFDKDLPYLVITEKESSKKPKPTDDASKADYELHADFQYRVVEDKQAAESISDAAFDVYREMEIEEQKTQLVCSNCCDPSVDEVLWGVDG